MGRGKHMAGTHADVTYSTYRKPSPAPRRDMWNDLCGDTVPSKVKLRKNPQRFLSPVMGEVFRVWIGFANRLQEKSKI